jgi:hypothetical protein
MKAAEQAAFFVFVADKCLRSDTVLFERFLKMVTIAADE